MNSRGHSHQCNLFAFNLSILNSDRSTHFDTRTPFLVQIYPYALLPSVCIFTSVIDQYPFSDHFPILLSPISYVPAPKALTPPIPLSSWCFKRADWHSFTSLSKFSLHSSSFSTTTDMLIYFFVTVLSAAFASIPHGPTKLCSLVEPRMRQSFVCKACCLA